MPAPATYGDVTGFATYGDVTGTTYGDAPLAVVSGVPRHPLTVSASTRSLAVSVTRRALGLTISRHRPLTVKDVLT